MKKQFLFATLALATMFTACSKEEELSKNEGGTPVNFVIGGIGARTATTFANDSYTTVFEKDNAVGIYASGSATATNSKFTVGEGGTSLSGTAITYTEGEDAVFTTYSPYQENGSTTVELTVGDQTTQGAFDSYDFMTDTYTLTQGNSVSFEYEHQMSMVEVTMAGTIGLTADNLSLTNIQPTLTWTVADNSVATSGTATEIKMFEIAENTFVAMVPAQSISAAMFKTEIGEKTYIFTPNSAVKLNSGKIAKFTITIGETIAEVTQQVSSGTIKAKAWTVETENANIEFEEDVIDPNEILNLTSFADVTLGNSNNWTSVDGWDKWTSDNSSILIDNNILKLSRNSETSWNKSMAFYTLTNPTGQYYKVSFTTQYEGTADDNTRLYFNVVSGASNNLYSGIYVKSTQSYAGGTYADFKPVAATEGETPTAPTEVQSTVLVNIKVNGGANTGRTGAITITETADADLTDIHFCFYPHTTGNGSLTGTFKVTNLKIEKVDSLE